MKKCTLLSTFLFLTLAACGGGSTGGGNQPSPEGQGQKEYDFWKYLVRQTADDDTTANIEFYRMRYVNEDGSKAWFDNSGMPAAEPITDEDRETSFSFIKVQSYNGLNSVNTRFAPSQFYPGGNQDVEPNGPFISPDARHVVPFYWATAYADNVPGIEREASNTIQRGDTPISVFSVLNDKYSWLIPRYYDDGDLLVFDDTNSFSATLDGDVPRTNTYEECEFEFINSIDLREVTHSATGIFDDVLVLDCVIYSSNDDTELGYKTYYYAKNIGEIHRTTSLGQGIIHHVVEGRHIVNN